MDSKRFFDPCHHPLKLIISLLRKFLVCVLWYKIGSSDYATALCKDCVQIIQCNIKKVFWDLFILFPFSFVPTKQSYLQIVCDDCSRISLIFSPTASSISFLTVNSSNNALAVKRKKRSLSCSFIKKKQLQHWQRWINVGICPFNRRFPLQLPPGCFLFFASQYRGRACIFMVINTCTQSFKMPYLSHVTVWLHCLIWVSFNLSHSRLEINEGRKRHIWVS